MMSQGQARSSSKIILYLQSQPHIASNNWQPTDSLIGRKGTATGHLFNHLTTLTE